MDPDSLKTQHHPVQFAVAAGARRPLLNPVIASGGPEIAMLVVEGGRLPMNVETQSPVGVLVVDDDEGVLSILLRILRRHQYDAVGALNGEEALRALRAEPARIQVAVIDLSMPGISGAELAERIAKDHPETGIVIISGLPLGLWPERDRRILAHMPRGYLFALKPLIPSVLVRRIRFAHSAAAQERV